MLSSQKNGSTIMNDINKSGEVKTKNITFGLVFGWIFGVVVGVPALIMLFTKPMPGIFLLLAALIALPPVSKFLKEKAHVSLSKGLKIAVVIILLIIAGVVLPKDQKPTVISATDTQPTTQNNQPQPQQPALKVTAVKLEADYKSNQVAADAKYKGKLVQVTGSVESIGKDIMDTPYITLKGDQYGINNIQCMFSKGDESVLAQVSKGDQLTLQGTVSGDAILNILVNDCQIVK